MSLFFINEINAQNLSCLGNSPSGSIQILGDDISLCNDGVHLYLNFTNLAGVAYPGTDSYAVVQNTYNAANYNFSSPTASIYNLTIDDTWGDVMHLPFKFCYFGKLYNAVQIGSNGQISFDTTYVPNTSFNNYSTQTFGPLPVALPNSSSCLVNCILAPDHDIDLSVTSPGEKITYELFGTAPCRKFIVTWDSIPMYSSVCNNLIATQQAIIYENTNEIEINVKNKPLCASWNGGIGYEGIEDATGTKAFWVPGRNGTQWTDTGSSWAFVPAGAPDTNNVIYWMDSATNTVLDTGYVFNYFPTADMAVYVLIGDTTAGQGCGNIQSPYKHLYVTGSTAAISFNVLNTTCQGGTVQFNETGTATNFIWDFGDGQIDNTNNPNPTHTYIGQGPFTVTLTAWSSTCSTTVLQTVLLVPPTIISNFSYNITNTTCNGGTISFINNSINGSQYLWSFGDGQIDTNANPAPHTFIGHGPFTITLTVSNPGCVPNSSSQTFSFNLIPLNVAFTLSSNAVCNGTAISTNNTSTGNSPTYTWDMGNGSALINGTNVNNFTYNSGGTYTVTCTATDAYGCTATSTQTVFVDATPLCKFVLEKNPVCINENVGLLDQLSSNTLSFNWNNGQGKSYDNIHNVNTYYTESGDYVITLTANYAVCPQQTYTQTIHVDKFPNLTIADTVELCVGRDQLTIGDYNNPGATYVWSTNETTNSIIVNTPNLYTVTASYGKCASTASKLVIGDIDCIVQPNAFTPNNDGANDYFKPIFYNVNEVTFFEFKIFNRWGQEVYSSTNKFDKGWNGNYNGKAADADTYTYVYTIELINGFKKSYQGDFILIR